MNKFDFISKIAKEKADIKENNYQRIKKKRRDELNEAVKHCELLMDGRRRKKSVIGEVSGISRKKLAREMKRAVAEYGERKISIDLGIMFPDIQRICREDRDFPLGNLRRKELIDYFGEKICD